MLHTNNTHGTQMLNVYHGDGGVKIGGVGIRMNLIPRNADTSTQEGASLFVKQSQEIKLPQPRAGETMDQYLTNVISTHISTNPQIAGISGIRPDDTPTGRAAKNLINQGIAKEAPATAPSVKGSHTRNTGVLRL